MDINLIYLALSFGTNFERYEDLYFYPSVDINYEKLETTPKASTNLKKQEGDYFEYRHLFILLIMTKEIKDFNLLKVLEAIYSNFTSLSQRTMK